MKRIFWVVTFALCCSAVGHAQTIADVARRERARTQPQSSVSITNANLKKKAVATTSEEKKPGETPATATTPATTAPATPATTAATTAATTPAAPETPAPTDPRDEKYWREKF